MSCSRGWARSFSLPFINIDFHEANLLDKFTVWMSLFSLPQLHFLYKPLVYHNHDQLTIKNCQSFTHYQITTGFLISHVKVISYHSACCYDESLCISLSHLWYVVVFFLMWLIQGAVSIRKTVLPGMAIPMLKIRRPNGRLIFNIGIPIPGKTVFYIETGPWYPRVFPWCVLFDRDSWLFVDEIYRIFINIVYTMLISQLSKDNTDYKLKEIFRSPLHSYTFGSLAI